MMFEALAVVLAVAILTLAVWVYRRVTSGDGIYGG